MGRSQRKMERALERLDAAYAAEIRTRRLAIGERRSALDGDDAGARSAALAELVGWHRAAAVAAVRAADQEGGPGWLTRAGHDEAWLDEHLWDGHVQPLVGMWWVQVGMAGPA